MSGALDLGLILHFIDEDKAARANEGPDERPHVFVVFADVYTGSCFEFIAAYSTRERAEEFINAQDDERKRLLSISAILIDQHTHDAFWRRP